MDRVFGGEEDDDDEEEDEDEEEDFEADDEEEENEGEGGDDGAVQVRFVGRFTMGISLSFCLSLSIKFSRPSS